MVVPVGRIFSLIGSRVIPIGFTLIDNVLPDVWADRGHGDHVDTILTQSFFPLRCALVEMMAGFLLEGNIWLSHLQSTGMFMVA